MFFFAIVNGYPRKTKQDGILQDNKITFVLWLLNYFTDCQNQWSCLEYYCISKEWLNGDRKGARWLPGQSNKWMHTSYWDRFSKHIYLGTSKSAQLPQAWVYLKLLHISLSSIELNAIWDAWTTLRRLKTERPLAPAAMFQFTSWSNRNFFFDHCFLHKNQLHNYVRWSRKTTATRENPPVQKSPSNPTSLCSPMRKITGQDPHPLLSSCWLWVEKFSVLASDPFSSLVDFGPSERLLFICA